MKFLVDNALSPNLAVGLRAAGYDVVHLRDIGLASASDADVFQVALADDRVIVSEDTDFGTLLALRNAAKPSVLLFRGIQDRSAGNLLSLLQTNIAAVTGDLDAGAVVVIENTRIRIRRLPLLA